MKSVVEQAVSGQQGVLKEEERSLTGAVLGDVKGAPAAACRASGS